MREQAYESYGIVILKELCYAFCCRCLKYKLLMSSKLKKASQTNCLEGSIVVGPTV